MLRSRRWLIAGVGVLLLALAGAWTAWDAASRALDARRDLLLAQDHLVAASATLAVLASGDGIEWPSAEEVQTTQDNLAEALVLLDSADARLGYASALLPVAGLVPQARGAGEVDDLIALASGVATAGQALLEEFQPILVPDPEDATPVAQRARLVLVERGDRVDAALADLERWQAETARLRAIDWGDWLDRARGPLETLSRHLDRTDEARETFRVAREGFDALLGFDRPRTYVVVGQNEAEIRSTGGFMGTMGLVTISDGRILASRYDQIESFERPTEPFPVPPEPLQVYMGTSWFRLSDVNWWPDLATSSEKILEFLRIDHQIEADGVIMLTSLAMDDLMGVFQPLSLPEYQEPLNSENWRRLVESTLLVSATAERTYFQPVMQALLAEAQAPDPDEIPGLIRALVSATRSRDLQIYVLDDHAAAVTRRFNADGVLNGPAGSGFVAAVDSNVSWSKVQPAVHRQIIYHAGLDGVNDITITYRSLVPDADPVQYPRMMKSGGEYDYYTGVWTGIPGVFGNYLRVYLPPDAVDISFVGFESGPRLSQEGDLIVAAGWFNIAPGEQITVTVSYRLPTVPTEVLLWKQGGQANDTLRVIRNDAGQQVEVYAGPFDHDLHFDW